MIGHASTASSSGRRCSMKDAGELDQDTQLEKPTLVLSAPDEQCQPEAVEAGKLVLHVHQGRGCPVAGAVSARWPSEAVGIPEVYSDARRSWPCCDGRRDRAMMEGRLWLAIRENINSATQENPVSGFK